MNFAEQLATLPPVDHLAALLLSESGQPPARIDHRPGQAGSLRIYHAVAVDGRIDAAAARRALQLYAEHVADAEAQPGRHPNIDRLLALIARDAGADAPPGPRHRVRVGLYTHQQPEAADPAQAVTATASATANAFPTTAAPARARHTVSRKPR